MTHREGPTFARAREALSHTTVIARETSRRAFGATLTSGAALFVTSSLVNELAGPTTPWALFYRYDHVLLAGIWLVAGALAMLSRRQFLRDDRLAHAWGGPTVPVATSECAPLESPRLVERRARLSIALPLVGVSLLAPLTLHSVFAWWTVLFRDEPGWSSYQFAGWVYVSIGFVGFAHVVLVMLVVRFVRRLEGHVDEANVWKDGVTMALAVAGAAAVPGAIFILPPVLTFVTGMLFIPLMLRWAARTWNRERDALS